MWLLEERRDQVDVELKVKVEDAWIAEADLEKKNVLKRFCKESGIQLTQTQE